MTTTSEWKTSPYTPCIAQVISTLIYKNKVYHIIDLTCKHEII